ncbi:hypothetical protein GCM10023215_45790 [Pseudonocardia yuanmonensis]|uniref:Uncharacterized protein n=1 Tax=Pseudonocardia yuanmonensis TaxID=1095914 RepID=A0ABP8X698_9PSEU
MARAVVETAAVTRAGLSRFTQLAIETAATAVPVGPRTGAATPLRARIPRAPRRSAAADLLELAAEKTREDHGARGSPGQPGIEHCREAFRRPEGQQRLASG